jgi:hypothetical protein
MQIRIAHHLRGSGMSTASLLTPVFIQVFLTLLVMMQMGRARVASLQATRTNPNKPEVALGGFRYSDAATKAANNFSNQFELSVLFYTGVAIALLLKQTDVTIVAAAWGFALSRLAHAAIHLGSNIVRLRFAAYLLGGLCLLVLWAALAWRVWSGVIA